MTSTHQSLASVQAALEADIVAACNKHRMDVLAAVEREYGSRHAAFVRAYCAVLAAVFLGVVETQMRRGAKLDDLAAALKADMAKAIDIVIAAEHGPEDGEELH